MAVPPGGLPQHQRVDPQQCPQVAAGEEGAEERTG